MGGDAVMIHRPVRHPLRSTVAKPVPHGFASGKGWWVKFTSVRVVVNGSGMKDYEVVWHRTGKTTPRKRYYGSSWNDACDAFAQYVKEASKAK